MLTAYASKWDKYEILRSQLDVEYSSHQSHLREIADYFFPRRPQFLVTDNNRGDRKSQLIIDSTGPMAAETFSSGMMGGNTSPTSPWVRLTTSRPVHAENYRGKEYLDDLTDNFLNVCAKSNFYDSLHSMYKDGGVFLTSPVLMEEDFERVFHSTTLPVGSYRLGLGRKDQVEVLFRNFRLTVRQLVETFGMEYGEEDYDWTRFSDRVKALWDTGQREVWIEVCHVIMPNDEYDPERLDAKYDRFVSCYYERGMSGTSSAGAAYEPNKDRYLRETGYPFFPVLVYRFERVSGDAYGTNGPGATSLGDNKALQKLHKMHAAAIDKMVNPPMQAPAYAQNQPWGTIPNGVGYVDITGGQAGKFEPMYEVEPNTRDLLLMIQDHQFRINQAFYVDVILSLISPQVDQKDMTAREVEERHDEKYMRFGSVLERINQDVLSRAVDIILYFMEKQGLLDDPPEELAGEDIKIEFVSAMAASQKLVRLGGIERFTQYAITLSGARAVPGAQETFDKINCDNLLDAYADGASLPSKCMRTDDEAMETRKARAQVQAQQAMVEAIPQMAKAGRDMSETKMGQDSALDRVAEAAQQ